MIGLVLVLIFAVAVLVYALSQPTTSAPKEEVPFVLTMPPAETFAIVSHKNYTKARQIEATAKAKDAAGSSIEHLDYVAERFSQL